MKLIIKKTANRANDSDEKKLFLLWSSLLKWRGNTRGTTKSMQNTCNMHKIKSHKEKCSTTFKSPYGSGSKSSNAAASTNSIFIAKINASRVANLRKFCLPPRCSSCNVY